jgi:hypothetical protein
MALPVRIRRDGPRRRQLYSRPVRRNEGHIAEASADREPRVWILETVLSIPRRSTSIWMLRC